jgi:hypothetical protein
MAANLRDGVSPLAAILLVGSAGLVLLGRVKPPKRQRLLTLNGSAEA